MGSIVQQLQGLPQLTSTDPLCWLGLEPWTPQWTPHCSWAQPPHPALPQAPTSSAMTPAKTQQGSALSGDVSAAAVPVHTVHAGHDGQTPQQGRVKEPGPQQTPAASDSGEVACQDCGGVHARDCNQPACSLEEQLREKDIPKILCCQLHSLKALSVLPQLIPAQAAQPCCLVLYTLCTLL